MELSTPIGQSRPFIVTIVLCSQYPLFMIQNREFIYASLDCEIIYDYGFASTLVSSLKYLLFLIHFVIWKSSFFHACFPSRIASGYQSGFTLILSFHCLSSLTSFVITKFKYFLTSSAYGTMLYCWSSPLLNWVFDLQHLFISFVLLHVLTLGRIYHRISNPFIHLTILTDGNCPLDNLKGVHIICHWTRPFSNSSKPITWLLQTEC